MIPLAAGQCSLGFTLLQSLVGGLFGSVGFFINILAIQFFMKKYQSYKNRNSLSHD